MTSPDRTYSVLVVDDERNLREGSLRILARDGYDVHLAENGAEALAMIAERPFDVVQLDLKMPGIDGIEVLDHIHTAHPETMVLIVTGFATIETAIEAMKKGAYDFMTKPFRPEQLRLAVGRAVEHIRLKEERDRLEEERERGLWAITTEKSRLKTVLNGVIPGIIILEKDKRIVMTNPAFCRMLRVEADRLPGTYPHQHPQLAELDDLLNKVLSGRTEPSGDLTREIVIEDERTVYYRATANMIESETEKVLGLMAIVRDITLIKEQEKEKSAFVAMLTHELRSPLGAVDTQLHVILKGLAGELTERQQNMLSRMRQRVGNVLFMINDLLDLSKIEARQFVNEKKPADLNALVRDGLDLLSALASEKKLSLAVDLAEDLPPVLGDVHTLKEVAVNLVSNAIRYTPEGGRIVAATRRENDRAVFSVTDDGLGIAREYQEKIFERFFRVKDERARQVVGTGLGLPIVKAIVEDHQGTITVDSEIGRGSTFTVTLPLAEPDATDESREGQ